MVEPRQGAKAAYQKAIDSGHLDIAPQAALNPGILLHKEGDTEGALAGYHQALALNPASTAAHFGRENALRALGWFEDALAASDQVIALAPGNAPAYTNRGYTLLHLGRFENALAACNQAVKV
jgi:tetratricopeptide (TPR) repeat protein